MEDMIIIGSKAHKLNLSNILDKFKKNIRINSSLPNGNNGKNIDTIVMCNHYYSNFFLKRYNTKQLLKIYSNTSMRDYDIFYIEGLVKIIKDKNYTQIKEQYKLGNPIFFNKILVKLGIKIRFKKMLRTGIATVLEYHDKNNLFLYGFSINKNNIGNGIEVNIYGAPNQLSPCHCHENEYEILKELHKKKIVDLTFCLLEDSTEPILNCTELTPSNHCIKLLMDEFGKVTLKGDLFDKDFISDNYNLEESNSLTILTNKNE